MTIIRGGFKLEGFAELDAKLAALPDRIAKGAAVRGMKKASRVIADDQERLANPGLRDTIVVKAKARNLTGLAEFGAVLGSGGSRREAVGALRGARRDRGSEGTRVTVRIGSTSPLAHLFEFGTAPRTQKTTGRYTGIMPAEPFVRPSFDNNKEAALAAIKREITVEIGKSTARLERRASKLAAASG